MITTVRTFNSLQVPDEVEGLTSYLKSVETFCPFLAPSIAKDLTTFTVVHSTATDHEAVEEMVFASAYLFSERLRRKRATRSHSRSPLLCENLFFLLPHISDEKGKEILSWVHWVPKCRYTQLGVMLGKFAKGDAEKTKDKRNLPVPPCHFISIRDNVRAKDPRFFVDKAGWLLPVFESANDDGQDVFGDMSEFAYIRSGVEAFSFAPTLTRFEQVLTEIVGSGFYLKAKAAATEVLHARKRAAMN